MIRVLCTLVAVLAVSMLSGNATAQTGTLPPLPCPAYIVPPFDNVPIWVPQPITAEDATDCLVTYQNAVNAARKKHEKDWCACTTAQCRLDADRQFLRDIQDARDALYQCFEDAVGPNPNPDPGEDPNEWTDPVTNDPDCYRCPDALMFFFAYGVSYVDPWSMVGCLGQRGQGVPGAGEGSLGRRESCWHGHLPRRLVRVLEHLLRRRPLVRQLSPAATGRLQPVHAGEAAGTHPAPAGLRCLRSR